MNKDCKTQGIPFLNVVSIGEISSDLYHLLQCDIEKCGFDSLKVEQKFEIVNS